MTLLAIETAYDVCGAALVSTDQEVLGLEEQVAPRRHNELLAPAVERLLGTAGLQWGDLTGIAVSAGPGSYSGLRIGLSYAKGAAWGAGLPVYPVPTLASLLLDSPLLPPHWIAAWSHREQVYAQLREGEAEFGAIDCLDWPTFAQRAAGETIAGYLLERFLPAAGITYVQTCPSAAKVGKFVLAHNLRPTSDLDNLVPDYHHELQSHS